ncbi:MAG: hypothetical protein AB7O60_15340 [Variibacter sp.]
MTVLASDAAESCEGTKQQMVWQQFHLWIGAFAGALCGRTVSSAMGTAAWWRMPERSACAFLSWPALW